MNSNLKRPNNPLYKIRIKVNKCLMTTTNRNVQTHAATKKKYQIRYCNLNNHRGIIKYHPQKNNSKKLINKTQIKAISKQVMISVNKQLMTMKNWNNFEFKKNLRRK